MGKGRQRLLAQSLGGPDMDSTKAETFASAAVAHAGSAHLALTKQGRQVVDVPAQRREFGARCSERGQAVETAARIARQRRHVCQQTREECAA